MWLSDCKASAPPSPRNEKDNANTSTTLIPILFDDVSESLRLQFDVAPRSYPTRFDVVFSRRFHSGLIRNWKFFGFDMDVGDFELPDWVRFFISFEPLPPQRALPPCWTIKVSRVTTAQAPTQMRMCQMESKLDSLKKTVEDIDYVICRRWGCECVGSLKHQVKKCGLPKWIPTGSTNSIDETKATACV